jgi:hypothetical protein
MIASNTPAGFLRQTWGFFHLPSFSENEWLQVKSKFDKERQPLKANTLIGIDIRLVLTIHLPYA